MDIEARHLPFSLCISIRAPLFQATEKEPNIQAVNFMKMVLFTGIRRGKLFKLQWSHVDFGRGFINIIDPKGRPGQNTPLNASARAPLESHPRMGSDLFIGHCE
jgi:integrase